VRSSFNIATWEFQLTFINQISKTMKTDYYVHLEPGCFYHVFNQGNARVKVFYKEENYSYFLRKADAYLSDFVEMYSYCLLSNHFHMLIKIKEKSEILEKAGKIEGLQGFYKKNSGKDDFSGLLVSEMFRRLFMAYSKSINKQQNRTGSLFRKNFKRKKINNIEYLRQVTIYIHRNPSNHGIVSNFKDYPWSSYDRILEDKITKLKKEEVVNWFDDKQNFIKCHSVAPDSDGTEEDFPSL
jgi:putative transposase